MKSKIFRIASLLGVLGVMSWIGYQHQVLGGGPTGAPSVDSICPFGGLESLYSIAADGTWLRRVAPSALILFIATVVMTLVLGRVFCGWLCPLGALSELPNRIAKKFGLKSYEPPALIDKFLRLLKYFVLILTIYLTWKTGELVIRAYDPWMAWMHLSAGFGEAFIATMILFAVLIAGVFISRFWCRYLCPLGAALSLGQWISPVKVRRNAASCINCKKCDRACPVALRPSMVETVKSLECISCGECVAECPKKDTLDFATPNRKKVISALLVGIISVAILGGSIIATRAVGHWRTFVPPKSMASANPADKIFGWMNIVQVAEVVGLPVEKVIELTELPADTPLDVGIKKIPGTDDEIIRSKLKAFFESQKKK